MIKTLLNDAIVNYNSKFKNHVFKVYSKDDFQKILASLNKQADLSGNYFSIDCIGRIRSFSDNKQLLAYILCKLDKNIIERLISHFTKDYVSYDTFISNNKETDEKESDTLKRLQTKYPDLFLSKIWYYNIKSKTPYSKGVYDILAERL